MTWQLFVGNLYSYIMPKMLICPQCGRYQEDTRTIRKIGVTAKKAGMYAGQFALKFGAKALASYVGLDGDISQLSAGSAGTEIAKSIGLNPENVSDKVIYKCSFCKHYWEGMDNPNEFNETQIKTVEEHKRQKCQENKGNFILSLFLTAVSSFFIWLSFNIWNGRTVTEVSNTILGITTTATDYSWHYFVFWPLVIFSCIFALVGLGLTIGYYAEYKEIKDKNYIEYAKLYMNLVDDKKRS